MNTNTVALGRFGHHPDPAIDFCVEVNDLECEFKNLGYGIAVCTFTEIQDRIFKAMSFRVGGVPDAVAAKQRLRELEERLPL